jgi:hypothetical protein
MMRGTFEGTKTMPRIKMTDNKFTTASSFSGFILKMPPDYERRTWLPLRSTDFSEDYNTSAVKRQE